MQTLIIFSIRSPEQYRITESRIFSYMYAECTVQAMQYGSTYCICFTYHYTNTVWYFTSWKYM